MKPTNGHEAVDVRVARRLRAYRLAAGLTVREVAMHLGMRDHSILVRYENGSARPSLDRLAQLAQLYGLTLAALLANDDALVPLIAALERAEPQIWLSVAPLLE
jgi:transcriptional regulator with XRE-family HTH domain